MLPARVYSVSGCPAVVPGGHTGIRHPVPARAVAADVALTAANERLLQAAAAAHARQQQQGNGNGRRTDTQSDGTQPLQQLLLQQQQQTQAHQLQQQHSSLQRQQLRNILQDSLQLGGTPAITNGLHTTHTGQRRVQQDGSNHQQPRQQHSELEQRQFRHQIPALEQQSLQQPLQQPVAQDSLQSNLQYRYVLGADQDWSIPTGLAVTWLGTSSGTPTKERNISCTLVRVPEALYMVDCGEGSHRQMRKTGVHLEQVDTIFVTHLHGDHCFGIGGMLVSICNARKGLVEQQQQQQQRQQPAAPDQDPGALRLVGPPRLGELVAAMLVAAGVGRRLDLPLYVTEFAEEASEAHNWQPLPGCPPGQVFLRRLAPEQLTAADLPDGLQDKLGRIGLDWQYHPVNNRRGGPLFEATPGLVWKVPCEHAIVSAAQLQHRVPCWGYVFDEKQQSATSQRQQGLQQGHQQQVRQQPADENSSSKKLGRRILVLGDTVDSKGIAPLAHGADLISHEATFAAGMEGKAALAQHSTAWMAGQFAQAINAKCLVLTHFSARYEGSAGQPTAGHNGGRGGGWFGGRGGRGQQQPRRTRAWEIAEAEAQAKAAEDRAVMGLQREAEDYYTQGPVLLARDLFTVHVPQLS